MMTSILSLIVYINNPKSWTNRLLCMLGSMLAYIILFNYFAVTAETEVQRVFWIRSIMAITSIIPITMIVLAHTFPEREITLNKYFIFSGICFSLALGVLSYTEQIISHYTRSDLIAPFIPGLSTLLYGIYFATSMILAILMLFKKYKHSVGIARMQIKYFILGVFLVWGLIFVANIMFVVILKTVDFTLYGPSISFILVGLLTYAILRHRFLDVRMVAMRSIVYLMVGLLLSIAYALSLFTLRLFVFNIPINLYNLFTSTVLALIMAYSFHPLSKFFKSLTDKYFFKSGYDSNKLLRILGRIMSSTYVLADLTDLILHQIMQTLKISSGYIVLIKDAKITWHKVNGDKEADLKDNEIDYLIQAAHMKKTENVLIFEEMEEEKEKEIMRKYHVSIVLPLIVKNEVIGGMLLGPKESGDMYSVEDINILKIITPEIAMAIQNSESYEEIKTFNMTLENKIEQATDEFRQINEEVYKKNLELAERNKTLMLLRQIDEVVLSSVTDTKQIGQKVVDLIAETAHFRFVMISVIDKEHKKINDLAIAAQKNNLPATLVAGNMSISMYDESNLIVKSIRHKTIERTTKGSEILGTIPIQEHINEWVAYPMVVRGEAMGALVIGLEKGYAELSEYQKDLIDRLVSVIGISLDNAVLYQTLQDANERLKQIDYMKDEFVSVASHELRTPMTAIRSYLWLALSGKGGELTEKQKFYLERSYNSTTRLIKLVNDMLNVSRIESGRMSFEMQEVDMAKLTDEVIGEVKPRADELGVILRVEKALSQLPHVVADPDKIKEVMINFIGNAFKFTPKEGEIVVHFKIEGQELVTTVTDTGEGIANDDISKLFQKFSLVKGSYQTNQQASQGTGLGLYISKSIITEHQGKIWAASPGRGKGATFGFTLPLFTENMLAMMKEAHGGSDSGLGIIHTEI